MEPFEILLKNNKEWAQRLESAHPGYFKHLAELQTPKFLWIGCSDSRVPATQITDTAPGEIFVHRNIANMVVHTDMNLSSVMEYALRVLKVEHIIVCGHYGCGGIKAAITKQDFGLINKWLRNVKDVYRFHREELDAIADEEHKADRLVELNVETQVMNLLSTSIVQEFWQKEQRPHLHGWVYGLKDGIIKPILHISPGSDIDPVYAYDIIS